VHDLRKTRQRQFSALGRKLSKMATLNDAMLDERVGYFFQRQA
jgi:hypothetical protein